MSAAQHKYDLLTVAPREGEFSGFTEALKFAMGSSDLIQGRSPVAVMPKETKDQGHCGVEPVCAGAWSEAGLPADLLGAPGAGRRTLL